jgi:hypothetical protein
VLESAAATAFPGLGESVNARNPKRKACASPRAASELDKATKKNEFRFESVRPKQQQAKKMATMNVIAKELSTHWLV